MFYSPSRAVDHGTLVRDRHLTRHTALRVLASVYSVCALCQVCRVSLERVYRDLGRVSLTSPSYEGYSKPKSVHRCGLIHVQLANPDRICKRTVYIGYSQHGHLHVLA